MFADQIATPNRRLFLCRKMNSKRWVWLFGWITKMTVYSEMTDEEQARIGEILAERVKDLALYSFFDQECEMLDCKYCGDFYVFFPYGIEREICWKDECWDKWESDEEKRIEGARLAAESDLKRIEKAAAQQRADAKRKEQKKRQDELERVKALDEERNRKRRERVPKDRTVHKRIGVVYLMESVGYYKIGITTNIKARQKQINKEIPVPVRVIHYFASDYHREIERILHQRYADQNAEREWFELTPEQVNEIKNIQDYALDDLL